MKVEITIVPKKGLLDPQGKAVQRALENLGYSNISDVHVGKTLQLEIKDPQAPISPAQITEMCEKLLANTVVEDYTFKII